MGMHTMQAGGSKNGGMDQPEPECRQSYCLHAIVAILQDKKQEDDFLIYFILAL